MTDRQDRLGVSAEPEGDEAPRALGVLAGDEASASPPDPEAHEGDASPLAPELRRQRAFDVAWRHLAQRDRTEAELRANFARKGVEPALGEEVLDELREGGYVDDAAYARRFAEDRRNLDGWGAERIERRLAQLGIPGEDARAALAAEDGHSELDAACELLARRFPAPPKTPRDRERALGFLVRKGYELELAHDALRRHATHSVDA